MVSDLRKRRLESEMLRQLGSIISRMNNPRLRHMIITEVTVSPDMRYATIYYTYNESEPIKQKEVEKATGYFRTRLASSMELRYTPALTFKKDSGTKREQHIDELLREINDE